MEALIHSLQGETEDVGGLLDNAREGNGIDDPAQIVCLSVPNGEGKRGQRLAAACGDGEPKQSGGLGRPRAAGFENSATVAKQFARQVAGHQGFGLPPRKLINVGRELRVPGGPVGSGWFTTLGGPLGIHELLGGQEVSVYQGRKKHACEEGEVIGSAAPC